MTAWRAWMWSAVLLALPCAPAVANPFDSPEDTSLAPSSLIAGGVASTSFGSNGVRSSAIQLDTGQIAPATHGYVAVAGGQGPSFHGGPTVRGQAIAAGVTTELPFGTLSVGVEQNRTTFGR